MHGRSEKAARDAARLFAHGGDVPAFRNGAEGAIFHGRTNSLSARLADELIRAGRRVRRAARFPARARAASRPGRARACGENADASASRSIPHRDRRRQSPHRRPAASAPFLPVRPASRAGAAAIHSPMLSSAESAPRASPSTAPAAPGRGSRCRPRPCPSGLLRGASSPAGRGSGRSPPCRSGRLRAPSTALRDSPRSRIGGAHLNSRRAVGNLFGGEPQIVRAGFHGDGHAAFARLCQHGQSLRAGEMHDVDGRLELFGQANQQARSLQSPLRRAAKQDRWNICANRRRLRCSVPVAASTGPATSAWASSGRPVPRSCSSARRSSALIHPGKSVDAGVNEEALEARNARARPAASAHAALPRTTPPHAAQSTHALPRAAARLASSACTSMVSGTQFSGMSTSVVTPPAAAARVAVSKAFPLGAARLVDVDVRVHQAGQQHRVAEIAQLGLRRNIVPAAHRRDALVLHHQRRGCEPCGGQNAG